MILAHSDLVKTIEIKDKIVTEWIIESPELFSQYLIELSRQINGADGKFILSNNEKELSISKFVSIIINPIDTLLNDKKIITKIYKELQQIAINENNYLKTKEMLSLLQQYLLELEYNFDLTLHINDDIELQGLFKLFGIKIEEEDLSFFEQLLQYIKIQNAILGKNLIILVNIRSFLTEQEMNDILLFVKHNEINLLLIECYQRDFTNSTNKYIIDRDKCEI